VCRIYDFGSHVMAQTGAQISFLTMEFVDGETLGQRRAAGQARCPSLKRRSSRAKCSLACAPRMKQAFLHRDFQERQT